MVQINLRKVATKKEILSVINTLVSAIGTSICIQDADGNRLVGTETENSASKYAVELSGQVIGWVIGEEKAAAIASLLSHLVKQEFEKKALAGDLLDKYREITLLHDISTKITATLDLKELAQLAIEKAGKLIESTSGTIVLLNEKTGLLEPLAGFSQSGYLQEPIKLGEGIIGSIVQMGRGEIVNDTASDRRFVKHQEPLSSLICVPLRTKERAIGAIAIGSDTAVTYTAGDLKLLSTLAFQAAVAIEKALLYEQSCTAASVAQAQAQQLQQALHQLQRTQSQLVQSEKMSTLGQLVTSIACEITNPVNFISGNFIHAQEYTQDLLQLLQLYQHYYEQPAAEVRALAQGMDLEFVVQDLPKLLSSMRLGIDRIRQLVLSLRNFSRLDWAEMTPANIHEGIDSTLLILNHRLKANPEREAIQVIKEYGNLPLVQCYAGELNQVFLNLLNNAIDALANQSNPQIIIRTELVRGHASPSPLTSNNDKVFIRIRDNGSGMSESVKSQLFQPFFTTKPAGKGIGLGLSISHQIVVEKHGGILKCLSQPGEGSEFWIQIPVTPQALVESNNNQQHGEDMGLLAS